MVILKTKLGSFHNSLFNYTLCCFGRLLIDNEDCKLIAVHKARYYKRTDGLSLGPGPFVEALEYASSKKAVVVGKPQLEFFQSVLQEFSCSAEETVMIGDVNIYIMLILWSS